MINLLGMDKKGITILIEVLHPQRSIYFTQDEINHILPTFRANEELNRKGSVHTV